jgi:hypothetical protein
MYEADAAFMGPNLTLEDSSTAFTGLNSIREDYTTSMDLTTTLKDSTTAFMDLNSPPAYRTDTSYRTTDQIYSWIRGDIPTTTCQLIQRKNMYILKERSLWSTSALCKAFCLQLYSNWFGLTEYTRATGLATLPFTLIGDTFVNMPLQVIRDAFELWCTERRAKQYMVD